MIRVVIENILLFLLPTLIYVGYMYFVRRGTGQSGKILDEAPLLALFAAGASLVVVTLIAFGSREGGDPRQGYQPPVLTDQGVEGGKVK